MPGPSDRERWRRSFSETVRRLRDERGWTQEELAERAEMSRSQIQHIEYNRDGRGWASNPKLDTIMLLAHAFEIEVGDLIHVDDATDGT